MMELAMQAKNAYFQEILAGTYKHCWSLLTLYDAHDRTPWSRCSRPRGMMAKEEKKHSQVQRQPDKISVCGTMSVPLRHEKSDCSK